MGKPRMIILIRHAQSEGNKNRSIHQTVPDHRVKLTPEGQQQALAAGRKLRSLLRPSDTLHFFTSPYRRTRETTEGILSSLTSDDPTPSPFPRNAIKVYEEPRLREQDFGNFQPNSEEMERMWQERADYGHFFFRIPNGESAADAYDRISGFNESLWRLFGEDDCASVCILVTHGLMTRVFLMKWYHFSVEYFEDLRNVNHCEFVVMKKNQSNGRYILQNQLRTWSELRRERQASMSKNQTQPSALSSSPIPVRKKWGGAVLGSDWQTKYPAGRTPQRKNTLDMFKDDEDLDTLSQPVSKQSTFPVPSSTSTPSSRHQEIEPAQDQETDPTHETNTQTTTTVETSSDHNPKNEVAFADSPPISPSSSKAPKKTAKLPPNDFNIYAVGRDGGGSRSGAASPLASSSSDDDPAVVDEEEEGDEAMPLPSHLVRKETMESDSTNKHADQGRKPWGSLAKALNRGFTPDGEEREVMGMSHGAMADALGDQSDVGSDGGGDLHDELVVEEEEDKSLGGSVY